MRKRIISVLLILMLAMTAAPASFAADAPPASVLIDFSKYAVYYETEVSGGSLIIKATLVDPQGNPVDQSLIDEYEPYIAIDENDSFLGDGKVFFEEPVLHFALGDPRYCSLGVFDKDHTLRSIYYPEYGKGAWMWYDIEPSMWEGENRGEDSPSIPQVFFEDVMEDQYFFEPVMWAVDCMITNGTSATRFSPEKTCTQAQILTFLWRAVGQPEPVCENLFTNSAVREDQYFYNALLWCYEAGILTDADLSLDPNASCLRSDVVLYLWRMEGSPKAAGSSFTDVAGSAKYAQAVEWAVKRGVTTGTSANTFSPGKSCTRGQIVTFLFRYLVETM